MLSVNTSSAKIINFYLYQTMKKPIKKISFVICVLFSVVFFSACNMGEFRPRIDQEVRQNVFDTETNVVTYVWYHGEIVWSKYDPIEKADSTLIAERYKQAKEVVKLIKQCN